MATLNQNFHTSDGVMFCYFDLAKAKKDGKSEAEISQELGEGNFITNIGGKIKAFVAGEETSVPAVLYNEVETPYYYIANLKEFADRMARKHGVYKATKNADIRVFHVATDEDIKSVLNGVNEAMGLHVDANSVLVQNIIGGEFYVQQKDYLKENYTLATKCGMYDVYTFTGGVQEWTFCEINIFAALWDGIQFLATPMLRIDNPKDVYGCNYSRFWGDDKTFGTHKVLGFFRACGTQYFETAFSLAIGAANAPFTPPKALAAENQEKIA